MRIERLSQADWGDALPDSGAEVFHLPAALAVLDAHSHGELQLLGGFKGDHPVALLPVFVRELSVGRVITSPPPSLGVPRLGPLLMPTSPKRTKQERVNRRFVEGVLETLDADASLTLIRLLCPPTYTDPRPFDWRDLEVNPAFTYRLDVGDDPETVMDGFSSSLRREIRDAQELDIDISIEGREGARAVYEATADHYEAQGEPFGQSWEYVRDLVDGLEDRSRVYVARDPDGTFLGGITVLYSDDAGYFWQGGVRASYDGVSVNSLLHWRIIEDIATDPPVSSVTGYDLVGANTERLCEYKAKFGASLSPYYVVESSGPGMEIAKAAFRLTS